MSTIPTITEQDIRNLVGEGTSKSTYSEGEQSNDQNKLCRNLR